jgi:heterodisulfide reductase subunit A-like polyferredoxin
MNSNDQQNNKKPIGAVAVVGAGIGGIQASLDLANSGFKVYLVEEEPTIGGRMAQLDKTFPTNDCSMCIISPKLVECGGHPNIENISVGVIPILRILPVPTSLTSRGSRGILRYLLKGGRGR